jgi:spore coat polysaccharide biosynthesis protein SpsF (cytidylyltransferase family)
MARTKKFKQDGRVVAIVQARTGSTRFPNKVYADIYGKPCIQRVVERIRLASSVDEICLAVPSTDHELAVYAIDKLKTCAFKGAPPENNVLRRVVDCARAMEADYVVDITADCPMVCPKQIDNLVDKVKNMGFHYASNIYPQRTWPDGFDVQVYKIALLNKCDDEIDEHSPFRQHSGWNIINSLLLPQEELGRKKYNTWYGNTLAEDYSKYMLTLDYDWDAEVISKVWAEMGCDDFTALDVLPLLKDPSRASVVFSNISFHRKQPGEL